MQYGKPSSLTVARRPLYPCASVSSARSSDMLLSARRICGELMASRSASPFEPACILVSVVVRNRIGKMWSCEKHHLGSKGHTTLRDRGSLSGALCEQLTELGRA